MLPNLIEKTCLKNSSRFKNGIESKFFICGKERINQKSNAPHPSASIVAFRSTRPPIDRITERNSRFYFFPSQLARSGCTSSDCFDTCQHLFDNYRCDSHVSGL